MDRGLDIAAYFERIGFQRPAQADESTLAALVLAHATSIPFENLSPLMGQGVPLDIGSLERKMVRKRRGGYCFEHNMLLWAVLRALGFEATGLAARVVWGRPEDAITPRTHMLLRVALPDGPRLVDVGFGGCTLTGVLRLEPEVPQATPHEHFRLIPRGDEWRMQAQVQGAWKTLYRFDLQPQLALDYELANHYVATHPQSHFVQHLMCARAMPGGRFTLLDKEFTTHTIGGESTHRTLAGPDALCSVLVDVFGIALPPGDVLKPRLAALFG